MSRLKIAHFPGPKCFPIKQGGEGSRRLVEVREKGSKVFGLSVEYWYAMHRISTLQDSVNAFEIQAGEFDP